MMTLDAWRAQTDAEEAVRPAETPAPIVRGSLSKAVIRERIAGANSEMRDCFECALNRKPPADEKNVAGRRQIKFIIGSTGHVAAAGLEGVDDDPEFTLCMLGVLQGIQFPPPDGGGIVVVAYPWIFEIGPPPASDGAPIYPLPHGATR